VYYYPNGKFEIIKVFNPRNIYDYYLMFRTLVEWNYGTCKLCPIVKIDMDFTS